MLTNGKVDGDIVIAYRLCAAPAGIKALASGHFEERLAHLIERPSQIDGRGSSGQKHPASRLDPCLRRVFPHCKAEAVGRHSADERRAAYTHLSNGAGDIGRCAKCHDRQSVRQGALIDYLDATLVAR